VIRDHALVRLPSDQPGTWADVRQVPPAL
jgi:hypothetical protein